MKGQAALEIFFVMSMVSMLVTKRHFLDEYSSVFSDTKYHLSKICKPNNSIIYPSDSIARNPIRFQFGGNPDNPKKNSIDLLAKKQKESFQASTNCRFHKYSMGDTYEGMQKMTVWIWLER
jgi:hypothetical protein